MILSASLGLQVLLFPFQALGSGFGEEADVAFQVGHFPVLATVIKLYVGGAVDFQPAEFMERNSLSPKTKGCAVGVK